MGASKGIPRNPKIRHKTSTFLGVHPAILFLIHLGNPLMISSVGRRTQDTQSTNPLDACSSENVLSIHFVFSWLSKLSVLKFASSFLSVY